LTPPPVVIARPAREDAIHQRFGRAESQPEAFAGERIDIAGGVADQ
jgi:hypothetical protein